MMTREELEFDIREVMDETLRLGCRMAACQRIADHDQAQRAVIAELKQQIVDCLKLNEADKAVVSKVVLKHSKTAIEQIEQQAKEIESHKTEIARLKNELSHRTFERFNQLGAENKTLREALQLLYDCQNGCPLPKYEADWNRAMKLAEQVLKEEVTGA